LSSGRGFIQGPDGDRLTISFENIAQPPGTDPPVVEVEGTQWITGGTGRFAGASGTQSCSFRLRFDTPPVSAAIDGECQGTIVYGASD
jgi:hypothetical protein